jgi:hypothetical protein
MRRPHAAPPATRLRRVQNPPPHRHPSTRPQTRAHLHALTFTPAPAPLHTHACSSRVSYKYVVLDASGAPLRWQEGPNLGLALPEAAAPPAAACVEAVDSWCGRLQLRRALGPMGPWEMCGPSSIATAGAGGAAVSSNVVAFDRPARAAAAAPQADAPPAGAQPRPRWPRTVDDAAAALPSLQRELEGALDALSRSRRRRGGSATRGGAAPALAAAARAAAAAPPQPPGAGDDVGDGEASAAAALGAAVAGLRELQALLLAGRGAGGAPAARDVECLRGAFAPGAAPLLEDLALAAADAAAPGPEPGEPGGHAAFYPFDWDASAAGGEAAADFSSSAAISNPCSAAAAGVSAAAVDPLVAALLSDACEAPCAYLHEAISGSCSGEWGSAPLPPPDSGAGAGGAR